MYGFRPIKPLGGDGLPNFSSAKPPKVNKSASTMGTAPQQSAFSAAGMTAPQLQPITMDFMQSGAMPMAPQAPQQQGSYPQPYAAPTTAAYDPLPPVRNPVGYQRDPLPPIKPPARYQRDPMITPEMRAIEQWNAALSGYTPEGQQLYNNRLTNRFGNIAGALGEGWNIQQIIEYLLNNNQGSGL